MAGRCRYRKRGREKRNRTADYEKNQTALFESFISVLAPHLRKPHIYYLPSYSTGTVQLSWDMLNSQDTPASFYVEVRQWNVHPYLVGPTVSVAPDGTVSFLQAVAVQANAWALIVLS